MIFMVFDTQEDISKFLYIYEKYGKYVYYSITRFVSDKNTIEDLSQDIYIILGKNLEKMDLDNPQSVRNYIITVSRNYCKNYLRKQSKVEEEPLEKIAYTNLKTDDILNNVIRKELIKHLADEIGKLDDIYKTVFELKYITGMSDKEIAETLNIKKKTVQMRLYRAKNVLRKSLEEL